MLRLVADGHTLATSCVNLAEVEAGFRQRERRRAEVILGRLRFLGTDREAAHRAGRYQAEWARRGRTIQTPDALVAGTAGPTAPCCSRTTPTTSRWATSGSSTRTRSMPEPRTTPVPGPRPESTLTTSSRLRAGSCRATSR